MTSNFPREDFIRVLNGKELFRLFAKAKVHSLFTTGRSLLDDTVSQMQPLPIPLLKALFNIIIPDTHRFSKWSPFPRNILCASLVFPTHVTCPVPLTLLHLVTPLTQVCTNFGSHFAEET